MKSRLFSVAAIAVLLFNVAAFAVGDARAARLKKAQVTRLVGMLPASDGVVVFESKRFLSQGLPKILSADQAMLGEVMGKVTEMETVTGIDLRKFDQVAVGVAITKIAPDRFDFDTVAIANGDVNAGALVAVAKLASKGSYREEKIGARTVYVFSARDFAPAAAATAAPNSKLAGWMDQALKGLTKDVAVTELDRSTLAIGSLPRIRQTLAGGTRPGADVTGLLSTREASVLTFAMKTPGGLGGLLPVDDDVLGVNLNSIDYVSGALDLTAAGANVGVSARTKLPEQAQSLRDTLDGLKMVGGAVFGNSKRADQQVYGRLLKNVRIENRGNDVSFDIPVAQADIDSLLKALK